MDKKYYGDYIVGTQTAWQAFATKDGTESSVIDRCGSQE